MQGVAHYPLDAWNKAGDQCFTKEKWALMCLAIAETGLDLTTNSRYFTQADVEVFENLFTVSTKMKESGVYR